MTKWSPTIFSRRIQEGFRQYVRMTAVLFLPVLYFVILYYLTARAWENAAIQINMLFAQKISMRVILIFSIYPIVWLCTSAKQLSLFNKLPLFTRIIYIILLGGIISAHIVTWLAVRAGQYAFFTLESLIRYDLILLDIYAYWKSDRKGLETGLKCLEVIIWLSAIYGIVEFFLPKELVLFEGTVGRARSVYSNPIISGSVWLMGFWLPFPSKNTWISGFVKSCYVAAIFFTISKDSWIGLGVSIALFLIWNRNKIIQKYDKQQRFSISIFAGLLLVLIMGVLYINKEYRDLVFFRWTDIQTDDSFMFRLYNIKDTIRYILREAPVTRVLFGYGNSLSREFIKSLPHFTGLTNLDNQYLISLYEFGLWGLLCLILWAVVCCRAAARGDSWQKAAGMGIVAMLIPIGTYDPFQWEIVTFLLLLLSVIALTGFRINPNRATVIKYIRITISVLLIGIFAVWIWPYAVSWCRTIYHSLQDLYVGKREYLAVVCFAVGLASFGSLVCFLVYCLFSLRFLGKKGTMGTGVLFGIFVLWLIWGNWIIAAEEKKLEATFQEEDELLQKVMAWADGYVYEDRYPWIYQKYEKNIRASIFNGESIIPEDSTTIMTGGSVCLENLLKKGFLLTYLSEDHALYTDDVKLIRALEAFGSHLTAYYHAFGSLESLSEPGKESEYDIHRFYDAVGRLIREEYYTIEGEKIINVKGYFAAEYSYDLSGRRISERYYGMDGQPSMLPDGYSILEKEYDAFGHVIWQRFYDGYHEPVLKGYEYAAVYDLYDMKGQILREEYYGTDGEPKELSGGYAATEREYDGKGNLTIQTFYDKENQPVRISSGYWKIVRIFNEKNQPIREEYFNTDGSAAWMPNGYYLQEMEYDEAGNIRVIRYLDKEENPTTRTQGYTELHRTYNDQKQIIMEEYFGNDGKPVVNTNGYAATKYEYDSVGNLTTQTFYGVDGKPLTAAAGYWKLIREYNFRKKVVRESYYDISGNPVTIGAGYASFETEYDENGNASIVRYYDISGNPVMRTDGFAELRRIYNNRRVIQETYYNAEGTLTLHKDGYAIVKNKYDKLGNLITQKFFGMEGERVLCLNSYWKKVQSFNIRNLVIREEFYGIDGRLAENTSGYAADEFDYDEAGNRILYRYYNAAGEQIVRTQGYALLYRIFREDRKLYREEYKDFEGKLVCFSGGYAAYERDYDEAGNVSSECYYDQYNNPVVQQNGYWKVERKYNERRQLVREAYLGVDGALTTLQDGYAVVEWEYDEKGTLLGKKYYDADEELLS